MNDAPVFELQKFTPRSLMGNERPMEREPFLIREVQQYLIAQDAIGMRWDIAWIELQQVHQSFVLHTPKFIDEPTESDRAEWREKARGIGCVSGRTSERFLGLPERGLDAV